MCIGICIGMCILSVAHGHDDDGGVEAIGGKATIGRRPSVGGKVGGRNDGVPRDLTQRNSARVIWDRPQDRTAGLQHTTKATAHRANMTEGKARKPSTAKQNSDVFPTGGCTDGTST